MDDFDRLREFLKGQIANEIKLTFDEVNDVMNVTLPPAARTHWQ